MSMATQLREKARTRVERARRGSFPLVLFVVCTLPSLCVLFVEHESVPEDVAVSQHVVVDCALDVLHRGCVMMIRHV